MSELTIINYLIAQEVRTFKCFINSFSYKEYPCIYLNRLRTDLKIECGKYNFTETGHDECATIAQIVQRLVAEGKFFILSLFEINLIF